LTVAGETAECPCFTFDLDEGAKTPRTCFCGDPEDQHDADGNCRVQHVVDGPLDPDLTAAALRLARRFNQERHRR
jgi:hypothetical protein